MATLLPRWLSGNCLVWVQAAPRRQAKHLERDPTK